MAHGIQYDLKLSYYYINWWGSKYNKNKDGEATRLNGTSAAAKGGMEGFLRRDELQSIWFVRVQVRPRNGNFQHLVTMKFCFSSRPKGELGEVLNPSPTHGDSRSRRLQGADPPYADWTTITSVCVQRLQRLRPAEWVLDPGVLCARDGQGQFLPERLTSKLCQYRLNIALHLTIIGLVGSVVQLVSAIARGVGLSSCCRLGGCLWPCFRLD